ncbi:MAG: KTSC domain-containing protein [Ignavibacteria bacterium]|jgi:lysyl-tRNA synthetase class 2|nr:KTSC domain-containing protein [Ignavibacteria bacterium]
MPSTVIRGFNYSEDKKILTVTFTTDRTYKYKNVPEKIYDQFSKATSKGRYFNFNIRDKYEYEEVD